MARIPQTLFINEFQKGASENASIGVGSLVGVETYSKKGVAQLTKDTTKVSGSVVTDLVTCFSAKDQDNIFGQGDTGKVYKSTDGGLTWIDISPGVLGTGHGIVFYENYLLAFRGSSVDYLASPYTSSDWTQGWLTGLDTANVITHFPFIFPGNNTVYFANMNKVGRIGLGTGPTFDPATPGTGYSYSLAAITLPSFYVINCISFLPGNYLVLGTSSVNQLQVADIIKWNPNLSTYETPLRLYGTVNGGVRQLINRNNILYAVTSGSTCIFETNGTTFNQVADLSLRTNIRSVNGAQQTQPILLFPHPYAISVFGNKLLTGIGVNNSYTPDGYFPAGVWSVAFTDEGQAVQCEYTISTGTVVATTNYDIGAIFPLADGFFSKTSLLSWRDGNNYGIDGVELYFYQNNINDVIIESEMMEIGTPLEPAVVQNLQINLTRNLIPGQFIDVYYRTSFDQDFTLMQSFDPTIDGSSTGYKILKNSIGQTRFVQFQIKMKTGTDNASRQLTPEIRNIIIQ